MLGGQNGLAVHIQNKLEKILIVHHCLNHRQELVIKHAKEPYKNFELIVKASKLLHSFYNFPTRRTSLEKYLQSKTPPQKMFTMELMLPIKWIEHGYKATSKIINKYPQLMGHLLTVWQFFDYKKVDINTQQQALDLINILTNKSFLSSLCFILDIQEIFRTHSLFYQKKEETIIGQSDRREKFVADLKKFQREGEGRWLNHLLR